MVSGRVRLFVGADRRRRMDLVWVRTWVVSVFGTSGMFDGGVSGMLDGCSSGASLFLGKMPPSVTSQEFKDPLTPVRAGSLFAP